jgi:hypothetical protein
MLQRYLKDVLRIDDDDLNREILEAWDVFNRSGTLVELMKYKQQRIRGDQVFRVVAGSSRTLERMPCLCNRRRKRRRKGAVTGNAKTKNKKWFGKHFEEVHWSLGQVPQDLEVPQNLEGKKQLMIKVRSTSSRKGR